MRGVSPGDAVYSFVHTFIAAIGWKVGVRFTPLLHC